MSDSYSIVCTHYRDIYGKMLWSRGFVSSRLYAVGDVITYDFKDYTVRRVAVANKTEHVNLEPRP